MAKQNIKDPGAHHSSSGALIRRFLPYLAKHKAVLFLDLFCAALTTLCDIFLPKIMSTITNDLFDVTEFAHHCPEEFFIAFIKILAPTRPWAWASP